MDDINDLESSPTEAVVAETSPSASSPILPQEQALEPPSPAPGQDEGESIFFDSNSLMDDINDLEVAQPAEEDKDETIFLDAGSLRDDVAEAAQPAEDDKEETIFLDTGSLTDDVADAAPAKKPADPVEKTKIGNYEVIKLLGKGGFGSVWKALNQGRASSRHQGIESGCS